MKPAEIEHPDLPRPVPGRRAWPIDEARQLLGGISRKTIYDLITDGALPTVFIGGRRLVPDRGINELIEKSTVVGMAREVEG